MPSKWYGDLNDQNKVLSMLESARTPEKLTIVKDSYGYKIRNKHFGMPSICIRALYGPVTTIVVRWLMTPDNSVIDKS